MSNSAAQETVRILLVEDNPADARLTREALKEASVAAHVSTVRDGEEAMRFLNKAGDFADASRPDLILLDLNLPRKSGFEVLSEAKGNQELMQIPIVVLTSSRAERDIVRAYELRANCFVSKPVDLEGFLGVVREIEEFWITRASLPPAP